VLSKVAYVVAALSVALAAPPAHAQQFTCTYISRVSPGPEAMLITYTIDGHDLIQGSPKLRLSIVADTQLGIIAAYPDPEMRFSLVVMISKKTGTYSLTTVPATPDILSEQFYGKCLVP
jgi:hypothetical protein